MTPKNDTDSARKYDKWVSHCGDLVHRLDRDRLMCAMIAPPQHRGAVLALLAFNLEIATIPELVSEPLLGDIRLQWWRDTVASIYAGTGVDHPVAQGLAYGVENFALPRALFDEYLDARAFDLNPDAPASLRALEIYADGTVGALNEMMGEVMGLVKLTQEAQAVVRPALRHAGTALALAGICDAVAIHAGRGRSYMPADLPKSDQVTAVMTAARDHLSQARAARADVPKSMLPVMMSALLAEDRLKRPQAKRRGMGHLLRFYGRVLLRSY